jgi:hypothetical protein
VDIGPVTGILSANGDLWPIAPGRASALTLLTWHIPRCKAMMSVIEILQQLHSQDYNLA